MWACSDLNAMWFGIWMWNRPHTVRPLFHFDGIYRGDQKETEISFCPLSILVCVYACDCVTECEQNRKRDNNKAYESLQVCKAVYCCSTINEGYLDSIWREHYSNSGCHSVWVCGWKCERQSKCHIQMCCFWSFTYGHHQWCLNRK